MCGSMFILLKSYRSRGHLKIFNHKLLTVINVMLHLYLIFLL